MSDEKVKGGGERKRSRQPQSLSKQSTAQQKCLTQAHKAPHFGLAYQRNISFSRRCQTNCRAALLWFQRQADKRATGWKTPPLWYTHKQHLHINLPVSFWRTTRQLQVNYPHSNYIYQKLRSYMTSSWFPLAWTHRSKCTVHQNLWGCLNNLKGFFLLFTCLFFLPTPRFWLYNNGQKASQSEQS